MDANTITLDDRDPQIVYSSGWRTGGSSTEYNGTTMYTNVSGATATLTFEGVGITVVGTVPATTRLAPTLPMSSYKLDSNETMFQPTVAPQQKYVFYQGLRLANTQHTLVVTNTINGSAIFILDYITITTATPSSVSGGSGSGGGGSSNHISVIAGSIGGVIAGIVLFLGILYFLRRRRRQGDSEDNRSTVPSVWVDSSYPSGIPLPPTKSVQSSSPALTASRALPTDLEPDIPQVAPPAYTTVVCTVTTTGTASASYTQYQSNEQPTIVIPTTK